MTHTESYIDHESVDSDLHMVSLAGRIQDRDILVWAVWKDRELVAAHREQFREWFAQKLGLVTGGSETELLKELVRISSGLQCRLYLYYEQKLYRAGERVEEGEYYVEASIGANVHKEGAVMSLPLERELREIKKELAESSAYVREEETSDIHALGNIWQRNIMDCIMEDSLSNAYFMLWEVR